MNRNHLPSFASIFGHAGTLPGDRAQLRIDHQVHRAAHVLILRALFDQLDEVAARQHQHLLAQSLHFGFDQIVGAAVDHARDREIDAHRERRRAAGEDDRIDDGDTERRGIENAEKPSDRGPLVCASRYSSSRKLYPAPRTVCSRGLSKSLSIAWRRRLMCTSITLV